MLRCLLLCFCLILLLPCPLPCSGAPQHSWLAPLDRQEGNCVRITLDAPVLLGSIRCLPPAGLASYPWTCTSIAPSSLAPCPHPDLPPPTSRSPRVWNYAKTPARGVQQLEVYLDDCLVWKASHLRSA